MSIEAPTATTETEPQETQVSNGNLGATLWGKSNGSTQKTETKKEETPKPTETKAEPQIDYTPFVKEFGKENIDDLKTEWQELQELKNKPQTAAEIKFANEESEKIFNLLSKGEEYEDELSNYFQRKKELKNLDAKSPEDRLKLALKYEHPDYTNEEVKDLFDEYYGVPEKPEYDELVDTEEQYKKKVSKWEKEVEKTKRKVERDSKDALNELKKAHSELILPNIQKAEVEPNNKEDEVLIEQGRNDYLKSLESDYKGFKGFEVAYKDKDVNVAINYEPTPKEIDLLKSELMDFDYDNYLSNRWFANDGKPQIKQIMRDRYLLDNADKIIQKVANDTWGKAYDHFLNNVKNIDVNGNRGTQTQSQNGEKSQAQVLAEAAWKR